MVVGVFSGGGAGGNRLFDDRLEISPLRVSEQFLQIPREPVFDTARLVGVSTAFKISMKLVNDLFVHNVHLDLLIDCYVCAQSYDCGSVWIKNGGS